MNIDCFPVGTQVWAVFPTLEVTEVTVETVSIWLDEVHGQTISYSFKVAPLSRGRTDSICVFATEADANSFRESRIADAFSLRFPVGGR